MELLLVTFLLVVLPMIVWRVLIRGRVLPGDDDDTLVLRVDSLVLLLELKDNF